jgi:hypothetical protein
MAKLLNGRINNQGSIIPLNDWDDIISHRAENSLLYRTYQSGRVIARLYIAEFDDGEAACRSEAFTLYDCYETDMTVADKKNRDVAIKTAKENILLFFTDKLKERDTIESLSTIIDCRRVFEQVSYDLYGYIVDISPHSMCSASNDDDTETQTLPLEF